MKVDLFDFHLPEENIALRPCVPREAARLLRITPPAEIADCHIGDLPELLRPGDALVFNDTKVIPAQLCGQRFRAADNAAGAPAGIAASGARLGALSDGENGQSAAHIQATLHKRAGADSWYAFVKPARRLKTGEEIIFLPQKSGAAAHFARGAAAEAGGGALKARVAAKGEAGEMLLRFNRSSAELDAALTHFGHMPLPPYIAARRAEDAQDKRDYQTVYAREEGAVAAPTAGLHFTAELMEALRKRGIEQHFITLHVGAGTFLPVKAEDTENHKMHAESGAISALTAAKLQAVKARGGKIIAVGTTALRLLESAANADGQLGAFSGATDIFITPGYRFRFADRLLTNFHLPRSTLFMLICAFSGRELMRKAYAHAIKSGYRFYSYGDACLLDLAENPQAAEAAQAA